MPTKFFYPGPYRLGSSFLSLSDAMHALEQHELEINLRQEPTDPIVNPTTYWKSSAQGCSISINSKVR
jgi:hypothetical protein